MDNLILFWDFFFSPLYWLMDFPVVHDVLLLSLVVLGVFMFLYEVLECFGLFS